MNEIIRRGLEQDKERVESFLQEAGVTVDNFNSSTTNFTIMENESGNLSGVLGIDCYESYGILRSFVIDPSVNEGGLARLFHTVYQMAKDKELSTMIAATNKPSFVILLESFGFQRMNKEELVEKNVHNHRHIGEIVNKKSVIFLQRAV